MGESDQAGCARNSLGVITNRALIPSVGKANADGHTLLMTALGGQVQFMMAPLPAVQSQIKAGKLHALAVTSLKRNGTYLSACPHPRPSPAHFMRRGGSPSAALCPTVPSPATAGEGQDGGKNARGEFAIIP